MTSFTQDGNGHTEILWLHFSIVEESGDASSIFFLQSMVYTMERQYLPHILQDQMLVSGAQDL